MWVLSREKCHCVRRNREEDKMLAKRRNTGVSVSNGK